MTEQRGHPHALVEADLVEMHQFIEPDVGQVSLHVPHDVHRREKLRVEVLGRELEGAAPVAADDGDDVPGAHAAHRPAHARAAVVVGGHGQRPGPQLPVVVLQQARSRPGGLHRIPPFVERARHAHVDASGAGHELPHAHGAAERTRVVTERGLHQRQIDQLHRKSPGHEDLAHVLHVAAGPAHTRGKTLADPPLHLDPVPRDAAPVEPRAHRTDHPPRAGALLDLHDLVDLRHVPGIEEHQLVRVVVEKDRLPELDGGLKA